MAKASFINKKAFIIMFVIILAIGGGVGLYFLFRPKADLSAPYKNYYSLYTNKNYSTMERDIDDLQQYITSLQTLSSTTSDENEKFKEYQNKFSLFEYIETVHNDLDEVFLENLPFTKNNDGKMLKTQQNMTKSYEEVLKKLDTAKNYYDTYLTNEQLKQKNNAQVINLLKNFDTFYIDYFCELCNFYDCAGQIFSNYLEKNFTVNRFSCLVITSTCTWQKQIAFSVNTENYNISQLFASYTQLQNFIDKNFGKFDDYYTSQTEFDNVLDCFDIVSFNDSLQAVIEGKYTDFENGLESDEQKVQAKTLKEKFFFLGE